MHAELNEDAVVKEGGRDGNRYGISAVVVLVSSVDLGSCRQTLTEYGAIDVTVPHSIMPSASTSATRQLAPSTEEASESAETSA